MLSLFVSIFSIASYPMDWIDAGFTWAGQAIENRMPAGVLRDLLVNGVLAGVGGVVIFLPQILILFFFLGLLEDSGYLARAAFLLDRVMHRVGLSGKSFIPLLSSYACAIPGIMATRTVEDPKDRLTTILIAPLMSCSARIPVYTTLIAAAVPVALVPVWGKALGMLGLYALGTGTAFLLAWLFRKKMLGEVLPHSSWNCPLSASGVANGGPENVGACGYLSATCRDSNFGAVDLALVFIQFSCPIGRSD